MSTRPAGWLLLLAVLVPVGLGAAGQGDARNGVVPANARFRGLTYGEWAVVWWQAMFAEPVVDGNHPMTTGGALERDGVLLLSGPPDLLGSPKTTTSLTIPSGTPLFFPIINVECSIYEDPPFHGWDEPSLRACARDLIDNFVTDVSLEIDGRPAPFHTVESPLFQWGPVPENNFLLDEEGVPAPAGTTSDAVAYGHFALVRPLSVGVHRIEMKASVPAFGIGVDGEMIVTVTPRATVKTNPAAGRRAGRRQW